MVFVPSHYTAPRLNAYLTTSLSPDDLAKVKKSFELGACSSFAPSLELVIKDEPSYHDKSHADIRRAEDAAGRKDPFIIIDERATADDAIWYVDEFATEDHVPGVAESTSTLLQILIKTDSLALTWVNYDIGNMDIIEDLEGCGVKFPMPEEYEQYSTYDCGLDMREQQRHQYVRITAEPGEFDESMDEELKKKFMPRPEKVVRLKADVAKENGLLADWMRPSASGPVQLPDGTEKTFPKGSVVGQCRYDPDFRGQSISGRNDLCKMHQHGRHFCFCKQDFVCANKRYRKHLHDDHGANASCSCVFNVYFTFSSVFNDITFLPVLPLCQ